MQASLERRDRGTVDPDNFHRVSQSFGDAVVRGNLKHLHVGVIDDDGSTVRFLEFIDEASEAPVMRRAQLRGVKPILALGRHKVLIRRANDGVVDVLLDPGAFA